MDLSEILKKIARDGEIKNLTYEIKEIKDSIIPGLSTVLIKLVNLPEDKMQKDYAVKIDDKVAIYGNELFSQHVSSVKVQSVEQAKKEVEVETHIITEEDKNKALKLQEKINLLYTLEEITPSYKSEVEGLINEFNSLDWWQQSLLDSELDKLQELEENFIN